MKKALSTLAVAAFWLAAWEGLYLAVGESILVPSPAQVLCAMLRLAQEADFWISAASSLLRVMAGFLLGALSGAALAVLTASSRALRVLLAPVVSIIKATPVASFIILALVWLRTGQIPAFTAFLIVFPPVWANVSAGICSVDRDLLEMARAFGMRPLALAAHLYAPAVKPYFIAAAQTGIGMAWKAGIAAEVIVSPKNSIGAALYDAKIYLDTTELFAWTIVVIILSMAIEKIFMKLMEKKKGACSC